MKVEDVAAYFKKKIAKAIPFGIETVQGPNQFGRLHCIIEPTAVTKSDGVWLKPGQDSGRRFGGACSDLFPVLPHLMPKSDVGIWPA